QLVKLVDQLLQVGIRTLPGAVAWRLGPGGLGACRRGDADARGQRQGDDEDGASGQGSRFHAASLARPPRRCRRAAGVAPLVDGGRADGVYRGTHSRRDDPPMPVRRVLPRRLLPAVAVVAAPTALVMLALVIEGSVRPLIGLL